MRLWGGSVPPYLRSQAKRKKKKKTSPVLGHIWSAKHCKDQMIKVPVVPWGC